MNYLKRAGLLSVVSMAVLSGCTSKQATAPLVNAPNISLKQCAKYEIIGDAKATVSDEDFLVFDLDGNDNVSGNIGNNSLSWFEFEDEARNQKPSGLSGNRKCSRGGLYSIS
ncbi:hypothetical protein [Vibrio agarivorans]|uniref:hypothetical protein n=1 Tax=Vibrio agarivorans TaxID=153622 RepID=UPI0025B48915|nr:hypothetical protein [Vibrio agarivorans]MDN3660346.1 hypothetical protein [Vibrio agarivorans]